MKGGGPWGVLHDSTTTYLYLLYVIDGDGAPADAAGDANGEKKEKVEDVENTGGEAS